MAVDLALFTYHQALKNLRDNLHQLAAALQITDAALENLGPREADPLSAQLLAECRELATSLRSAAAVLSPHKEAYDGTAP